MNLVIQFSKIDKFNNSVFSCSNSSNSDSFNELKATLEKLTAKYPNIGYPIYHNEEHNFITLRCMPVNTSFKPKNIYNLTVEFLIKNLDDGREFINCRIVKSTINTRYIENLGEVIQL